MAKAVVTPGQSIFAFGVDLRSITILKDSTREIASTSENLLAGAPVAMYTGSAGDLAGKLNNTTLNNSVVYGISLTNANTFDGKTSLGEFKTTRADVGLQGIFTVRKSVFLDNGGNEVSVSPFDGTSFSSGAFPAATDILVSGTVDLDVVAADNSDGLGTILRWEKDGTPEASKVFRAALIDVRDGSEVDILLS